MHQPPSALRSTLQIACVWTALFLLPAFASAQIYFTIQTTANSSALGYTAGQAATFSFTLRDFGAETARGTVNLGAAYIWSEDATSHPEIWSSVSGTGLTGTWVRPAATAGAPYSELVVYSDGTYGLFASHDTGTTGLSVNGSGVQTVQFFGTLAGTSFANFTNPLPNPVTYFSSYTGTYAPGSTYVARVINDSNASVNFTVNSVTISTSAVPEPSTYAALVGAAALGFAGWRRRARLSAA